MNATNKIADLWAAAARKALRGKAIETLRKTTDDGLSRGPLFDANDNPKCEGTPGQYPFTRAGSQKRNAHQPWDICQTIFAQTTKTANEHILQELEGGANSVLLHQDVPIKTSDDLAHILRGVDGALAGIHLDPSGPVRAKILAEYWQQSKADTQTIRGNFHLSFVRKQTDQTPTTDNAITDIAKWASKNAPNVRAISLCPDLMHEAGASAALELAWMASEAVHTMRILLEAGLSPNQAAGQMSAVFSVDADLHFGISKLRAARRIWARVMNACGVDTAHCALPIFAQTSRRMLTRYDPWVNILRASTSAFAAVLGGAEHICVAPFTHALGGSSNLSRRLARNTQMVLLSECEAARVIDPAGGSHTHEANTDQLAEKAWEYFQNIEAKGGLLAAMQSGWIAQILAQQIQTRKQQIRTRKHSIVGSSTFANLDETPPQFTPYLAAKPANTLFSPLRDAAEFEALRDAANAQSVRPAVFLASLGTAIQSAPRTGFARSALAAGGISHAGGSTWSNTDDMFADYDKLDTPLVLLCGADDAYEQSAQELAIRFKQAGAREVWIAGAGPIALDGQIHMGCDLISILSHMHTILGINK